MLKRNGWHTDADVIVNDVYEVKPYFEKDIIKKEFERISASDVFHSI